MYLVNNAEHILAIVKSLLIGETRAHISEIVGCAAADGISMADTHTALMSLQDAGQVVLYRNDNTRAITPIQHRTAIVINGYPRHLVYLA